MSPGTRDGADEARFLELRAVSKAFGPTRAMESVSFRAKQGEFVCVLGPSGCGKTTALRVIAGLEEPDAGAVLLRGRDVTRVPPSKRGCGIVFQSYALFPNLTALQNVAYGLHGRKDKRERASEMLALVGLADAARKRPPELSGGQQQRVALARALAPGPDLLLLDEPLSALDARVRQRLRVEVRQVQQRFGITTVMVTHDQEEALTMADRIVLMRAGRIEQDATPYELYHRPATPFAAGFIGAMSFLDAETLRGAPGLDVAGHAAIRPENVRITSPDAEGTLPAEVRFSEFRGPFYRLRLALANGSPEDEASQLLADVSASVVRELDLRAGRRVGVALPSESVLQFGPGAAAPDSAARR